ncbi:MAG: nitrophenyl compound nitroreductase subunit ArsF family protein [Bacteroidales bacterium]|nr:nitrophenyl compound nitroreductase subunit ArsF family protein [Bacteroidales bacterium]
MKRNIMYVLLAFTFVACGGNSNAKNDKKENTLGTDPSMVNVYYFHGKQRCKTCIAVGEVSGKTTKDNYTGKNVKFIEVNTSDKQFEKLVEKYQVTWNALIIAKGDNSIDLTEQAFANAIINPPALEEIIKAEIDKRL